MKWEETPSGPRKGQRIGRATGIPAQHVDVQVGDSSQNAEPGREERVLVSVVLSEDCSPWVSVWSGPVQGNLMWSTEKTGMNRLVIIVSRSKMESEGS